MSHTANKLIIVGAGLVGTSLAITLHNKPIEIQILETHLPQSTTQTTPDTRPISLSYGSYQILKTLGIWNALAEHACPIYAVHVSEQGKFGHTLMTAEENKVPALGFVVPFSVLQHTLYQKIASQSNVQLISIEKIKAIDCHDHHAEIHAIRHGQTIQLSADLLIAADGTPSTCRTLLQIPTTVENHHDTALIYQLTLSDPHDYVAYERITERGVLAILPLQDRKTARLVWSITPRIEHELKQWTDEQLLFFLQDSFEGRLSITVAKKTAQFPLQTLLAKQQILSNVVLLGNSAHTIYPIAAQGFNLGLHDVAVLADVLSNALEKSERLGDKHVLKRYEEWASSHQQSIIQLTRQLTPLFELQLPFLSHLRGTALFALDMLSPLKRRLAKRTMGIAGKLPRLLRGIRE